MVKITQVLRILCISFTFLFLNLGTAQADITYCQPSDNLQECIDTSNNNIISLIPSNIYQTDGIKITKSNTTFIIPKGVILKLADNAVLNDKAFGGVANSVIQSKGSPEKFIENIHIVIEGEIDGNKKNHPYEGGGVEVIDWLFVKNSTISGSGVIHSANGDGIDIDASFNLMIRDVTVENNDGSGIHFGSPRPIVGGKGSVVIGVVSRNNGFLHKRNGLDLSWPNPNGAIFINCTAVDNYRNYEIEAEGGVVYNSASVSSGKVVKEDDFSGADFVLVNGVNMTNKSWISVKNKILIKRDIKRFLGIESPKYLDPIKYKVRPNFRTAT
jgi:hypothetical protein